MGKIGTLAILQIVASLSMLAGTAAASSRFVEFSIERRCASTVLLLAIVAGDGRGGSRVRGRGGTIRFVGRVARLDSRSRKLWSPPRGPCISLGFRGDARKRVARHRRSAGRARAHHRPARPRRRGMVRRGLEHQHESCPGHCCSRPCKRIVCRPYPRAKSAREQGAHITGVLMLVMARGRGHDRGDRRREAVVDPAAIRVLLPSGLVYAALDVARRLYNRRATSNAA